MEQDKKDIYISPASAGEGNLPVSLISQLMQLTNSMQHVDEVFHWLSNTLVQRLNYAVVQFWAVQNYSSGQSQIEARSILSRTDSLPQSVHYNRPVAMVIERLIDEQRGLMPHPVISVFPYFQAELLTKYGLNYWAAYFQSNQFILPVPRNGLDPQKIPTPFTAMVSLFTEHIPPQNLLHATDFLLDQAFRIIIAKGFLTSTMSQSPTPAHASSQRVETTPRLSQLDLSRLVPHRTQNLEGLQINNPFANAVIITEKKSRSLYAAIDGEKNVAELVQATHLNRQELIEALRFLLEEHHIQLRNPVGKLIDDSLLLSLLT